MWYYHVRISARTSGNAWKISIQIKLRHDDDAILRARIPDIDKNPGYERILCIIAYPAGKSP